MGSGGKSGGGGGGGGSGETIIRYAPYLEEIHKQLLNRDGEDAPVTSLINEMNLAHNNSPYGAVVHPVIEPAFFGEDFEIQDFPSLWDIFGKFMAGKDVHLLWNQVYEDTVKDTEIANSVAAFAAMAEDDIMANVLPRFNAGMRDINAVMSSSYVTGRAIIEDARVKSVNQFAAEIRLKAVDLSAKIWAAHLEWNKAMPTMYSEMFKLYYATKMDVDTQHMDFEVKDRLWNLNMFENARALLGALGGGTATASNQGPSKTQSAIGGALSGAAMGAAAGFGPMGIAAMGFLGFAGGLF
jgi:hypothetical protein